MWIYPVDMKRANEFGQIFEMKKDEQYENCKNDIVENEKSTTDAVKRRVIKQSKIQN
jgi:hypothetical protein